MTGPIEIKPEPLEVTRAFFEERGAEGFEGTAMLAGSGQEITRCVIPDQQAYRSKFGVAVEVTEQGKLELASALSIEERYLSRIHSHPQLAFHSSTDDRNPGLTAEGALSIVVPFYGLGLRRGLEACALFVLQKGEWVEIPTRKIGDYAVVVS
jgi:hypothetical protein